ncbi:universal stress protein [Streptomyces sp. NPDC050523]|uniref:universal stress protein n=1 Tax=Streptomyces sp. NPDC050523 TaxID=3365622 RepID=UPI0037B7CC5B
MGTAAAGDMVTGTGRLGVVLVGVDGTPEARLAADWAATEAELRASALQVTHAVGRGTDRAHGGTAVGLTDQALAAALAVLDDARARLGAATTGVPIDTHLARDDPSSALLAASAGADLVVVGTRGRGGFAGLLLGSVSLKVAAHADRPVVVVRGDTEKPAGRDIVVGVRDERDAEAVRFALVEAELHQVGVRLVHAWTPLGGTGLMVPRISHVEEEREAHAQLLNHVARPVAEHPTVGLETELTVDSPAAALVEASARARLLVLPRHPVEGRLGLPLGTVVHAVLHHASCPVAVVPVG